MPGALLQLNSVAEEESYFTINPQISFFKSVYFAYNNYSKVTFEIPLNNSNSNSFFDKNKYTVKIPKYGDLIKEFYIKVRLHIFVDREILLSNQVD